MSLFQIFKMALKEIKCNKLRSFLTILGTAIGTASIILFVTISIGSRESMLKELELASPDLIVADIYSTDGKKEIKYEDIDVLLNESSVSEVSPVLSVNSKVKNYNKELETDIYGIEEKYNELNKVEIKDGRYIKQIDIDSSNKVVVLGSSMAKKLFNNEDAIGKYIQIGDLSFKVVGIAKQLNPESESHEDENVYAPFSTIKNVLKVSGINKLYVKASSTKDISTTINYLKSFLNKNLGSKEGYYINSNDSMAEMFKSINAVMDIMVGSISGISLFVAGIGIMNIMLVSVTERTKEIGIRKALGAKKKSILTQFLVESLTISLLGGLVGSVIGISGANVVLNLMGSSSYIAWNVVLISILFAVIMGVIFGIAPANKAADLKPIDALKSE